MSGHEHPNADRVSEFYTTLAAATDGEAAHAMMVDAFAVDAVWHHLGECHHARTYEGRESIIADLMASMVSDSDGTWTPVPVSVQAFGDEIVVVHMSESADIHGERHAGSVAVTFRLVDGKIVEGVRMMDGSLDRHWAKAAPAPA
jgi:ketosteroid isomerase-like protein